jgi:hypothetical protein
MSNMPQMAMHQTMIFRYIKQFHEKLLFRLQNDSKDTLRCAAWQLDNYLEEHGKFKDAEFIATLLHTIEYIIQKKWNCNWTVERAKKDLRGRTRGVNQFAKKKLQKVGVPITADLSKSIEEKMMKANYSDNP